MLWTKCPPLVHLLIRMFFEEITLQEGVMGDQVTLLEALLLHPMVFRGQDHLGTAVLITLQDPTLFLPTTRPVLSMKVRPITTGSRRITVHTCNTPRQEGVTQEKM